MLYLFVLSAIFTIIYFLNITFYKKVVNGFTIYYNTRNIVEKRTSKDKNFEIKAIIQRNFLIDNTLEEAIQLAISSYYMYTSHLYDIGTLRSIKHLLYFDKEDISKSFSLNFIINKKDFNVCITKGNCHHIVDGTSKELINNIKDYQWSNKRNI